MLLSWKSERVSPFKTNTAMKLLHSLRRTIFELRPLSELVYYVIWSKSFCYIFLKEHEISFNKKNWSLNTLILSLSYILIRRFLFSKLTCIRQLLQQLHPCTYISTHIAHNLPGTYNSLRAKCLSAGFCPIKS